MKKVTHYMYSCDTCCKIREMMEMDGLDLTKCQNEDKKTQVELMKMLMRMRQKLNSVHLLHSETKTSRRCSRLDFVIFRERMSSFPLDWRPFGPLVLDGARSKVHLCGEGYERTPILRSFDNSKR